MIILNDINTDPYIFQKASHSLYSASQWLLRNIFNSNIEYDNELMGKIYNFDDLDGMSIKMSALNTLIDTKICAIDPKFSNIHTNGNIEDKIEWFDHYVSDIRESYTDFLNRYIELLLAEKNPMPWEMEKYDPIFVSCYGCTNRFECLDLFKATLSSVFNGDFVLNKDSIMNNIFKSQINGIMEILNKYPIIENEKIVGFPHTITKKEVSAYNSMVILKFLIDFKSSSFVKFNEGIEDIQNNIIKKIESLQYKNDNMTQRKLINDSINTKGSWDEGYWGDEDLNRIKSTSNIASMLYDFNGKSDAVKNALDFVEKAFNNENFVIDLVDSRDQIVSNISDISGTISALKFYLNVGKDYPIGNPNSEDMVPRINWLIEQQHKNGYFPVLSKSLFHNRRETNNISDQVLKNGHTEYNMSLPNTVEAMNLLHLFLKKNGIWS